ncbi:hypothetical protein EYF80_027805 [Liparis tanakae]|uniref:Uncharacterized protein n=1 Tax=Liparis tanakae TaxID=230148 RepID=A0A4Z2H8X2_9TELE|nr:hypothetical protein EYF80_027805 [Liparis tanakae]
MSGDHNNNINNNNIIMRAKKVSQSTLLLFPQLRVSLICSLSSGLEHRFTAQDPNAVPTHRQDMGRGLSHSDDQLGVEGLSQPLGVDQLHGTIL